MTVVPRPVLDGDSLKYWEGLRNEELWIQRCNDCHQHIFYPRSICPDCFSEEITWVQSGGTGKIYSFTVVHHAFGPFKEQLPFVVAIVELDEGVRMMTRLKAGSKNPSVEQRVKVIFERLDEELTLPYFEPV
ncbi:Zn-ribbon domain-containing OB-fold protein [Neobacillus muris]|uniref:Zn-ribbon domain-containing OB-fold protein n=1 Tax=Neobacillus muris TaxID=2941334 RepID=UPI002041CF54|nr:Zn-ribbon domain-containing OB-fold protein [Neobacillus muris]